MQKKKMKNENQIKFCQKAKKKCLRCKSESLIEKEEICKFLLKNIREYLWQHNV